MESQPLGEQYPWMCSADADADADADAGIGIGVGIGVGREIGEKTR